MIAPLAFPSSECSRSRDGDVLVSLRYANGRTGASTAAHLQFRLEVRWVLV